MDSAGNAPRGVERHVPPRTAGGEFSVLGTAIPSDDDPVVIAGHLRETAERVLEKACDMAALALIPGAIEWEKPVRMPHTLEGVAQYERQLAWARELIEQRDGLGGAPPPPSSVI
jgi:hypothetical protein